MINNIHSRAVIVLFSVAVLLSGCTSLNSAHYALTGHPNRTVRYPSRVGEVAGIVVGVPVGVALALPSVVICNMLPLDDETQTWSAFYPFTACCDLGTIVVGGIPWCIFGRWGVPISEPNKEVNNPPQWPIGSYVETPTGSMIVGDPSSITGEFKE